jgi:3-phosphoshikimate 1-carboxyvinyltransferase
MARFVVEPSPAIAGRLRVPGDKSISHRAVMFGAIASGTTHVSGFLEGEDCLSTMRAVARLGVRVQRPGPGEVTVEGVGLHGLQPPDGALDMGNAGTAMRLFMGLLAAQRFDSELVGDASLMRRPMERVAHRRGAEDVVVADDAEEGVGQGGVAGRLHRGRRLARPFPLLKSS